MAVLGGRLGPFRFNFNASRDGAGVYLGLGGTAWQRLHAGLAQRNRRRREQQAVRSPEAPKGVSAATAEKLKRIAGLGWYHTLDLGDGVRTDGAFDHTPHLAKYRLPADLSGKRVLDIGSFDGFWSFEFERRGAAEVIAWDAPSLADLDFPPAARQAMTAEQLAIEPGKGFALAIELLQSKVQRRLGSVYAITPEEVGVFDMTHIGNVLVHLRDPAGALQRMARVTAGEAWIVEAYEPELGPETSVMRYMGGQQDCNWWRFSEQALRDMVAHAGFASVEEVARFAIPFRGSNRNMHLLVLRAQSRAASH